MANRYRFRLPDGQTFESERTPAQIRQAHPSATITHRVDFDSVGNPRMIVFEGKQSEESPVDESLPPVGDEGIIEKHMPLKSGKKA